VTPLQFKAARLALGYNQREMADKLKVSEPAIRSWEKGRRTVPGPAQVAVEMMLAQTVR
jgi:transcriptional regulator with XRE-family HTH domain